MILSDESIGKEYPRDVLFNATPVGDMLICRRDALSERVAELYGEEKIKDAIKYAKDLKDRYTVLWLNYDLGEN
jgi:hypothetical protein